MGYLVSERPETKSDVFKTVKFGLKKCVAETVWSFVQKRVFFHNKT